jgi:hypothetical protein
MTSGAPGQRRAVSAPARRHFRVAMVGAGAVVMHDVAPDATVAGVPARVIRAASDPARSEAFDNRGGSRSTGEPSAL